MSRCHPKEDAGDGPGSTIALHSQLCDHQGKDFITLSSIHLPIVSQQLLTCSCH